jgi:hypothetical protein
MIRKLISTLAVLVSIAGFGFAAAGSASASVIPHHGGYTGVDHGGRVVTFSYDGTQVTHFSVGHQVIGGAHVSQGMWHETCHNGMCTKGSWSTDGHATGFWRYGGGTWVPWSASSTPQMTPYAGTYMGNDHTGLRVHLSYHSGHLRGFTLDHNLVGDAPVSHGSFETCHRVICIKGHWENEYYVVGSWRHVSGSSTAWHTWEAYAYAA